MGGISVNQAEPVYAPVCVQTEMRIVGYTEPVAPETVHEEPTPLYERCDFEMCIDYTLLTTPPGVVLVQTPRVDAPHDPPPDVPISGAWLFLLIGALSILYMTYRGWRA